MIRFLILVFLFSFVTHCCGQEEKTIALEFPKNKELNLEVFVDFVQNNLELPLAYDKSVFKGDQSKLTIRPQGLNRVSRMELLLLLNNTLRIRGLALAKDNRIQDPYYTIKPIQELRPLVPQGQAVDFEMGDIFTQIFAIRSGDTSAAKKYVESFYSNEKQNAPLVFITELPERHELIVTGFKRDMLFVGETVRRFNGPALEIVRSFYEAQHTGLQELQSLLNFALEEERSRAVGQPKTGKSQALRVLSQESRNRLLLVGTREQIDFAFRFLREMDSAQDLEIQAYLPTKVSAARLDQLIRNLFSDSRLEQLYRSTFDDSSNRLIAKTTPSIHHQINKLLDQIEKLNSKQEGRGVSGRVRTYKLKNVAAKEILKTIRSIETTPFGKSFLRAGQGEGFASNSSSFGKTLTPSEKSTTPTSRSKAGAFGPEDKTLIPQSKTQPSAAEARRPNTGNTPRQTGYEPNRHLIPGEAVVESFANTIIVVAEPQVQELYAQLIEQLDKRPPQVLIEATVVSMDCSNDYSLGVEISGGDRLGARKILAFSSFGLSRADPVSGALSLIPGLGFNGTLVDPAAADAVLRALANHRKARVVSAPKILVNDNSEGELSSISEVPFTSVNASNTVSTTSFAGFAEAGTTIRVLPNISQGDHVNLDFSVTVNDFSGLGVDGIPPPRQTDNVASQVTIPDGHTVIVGGLRRKRNSRNEAFLPGLEHFSIFKLLGGSQVRGQGDELLFIFLKPVILRDDKFKDLRVLSEQEIRRARIPSDLPLSEPLLIQ